MSKWLEWALIGGGWFLLAWSAYDRDWVDVAVLAFVLPLLTALFWLERD